MRVGCRIPNIGVIFIMKLSECLLYRDIQELSQMAAIYECDCNINSKLELVQSIHHRMMSKSIYPALFKELDPNLFNFLLYILFQKKGSFSIDELVAKGKYICDLYSIQASPRTWVAQLLKRGWLFPSSTKYQIQLELAEDLQAFLKKEMIQYLRQQFGLEKEAVIPNSYRDEGQSILHDVRTFLTHVHNDPLPMTIEGVIHKRNQQLLMRKLNVEEELILEKSWRFGYGRRFPSYPNRFALIYDFCFAEQWIEESMDGCLRISLAGEKIIQEQEWDSEAIYQRLILFWIKTYKQPIQSLPFLLQFMAELMKNEWMKINDLFLIVKPWLKKYYYDEVDTLFRERIVQMLLHLGLLQVTLDESNKPTYCRLKIEVLNQYISKAKRP